MTVVVDRCTSLTSSGLFILLHPCTALRTHWYDGDHRAVLCRCRNNFGIRIRGGSREFRLDKDATTEDQIVWSRCCDKVTLVRSGGIDVDAVLSMLRSEMKKEIRTFGPFFMRRRNKRIVLPRIQNEN